MNCMTLEDVDYEVIIEALRAGRKFRSVLKVCGNAFIRVCLFTEGFYFMMHWEPIP